MTQVLWSTALNPDARSVVVPPRCNSENDHKMGLCDKAFGKKNKVALPPVTQTLNRRTPLNQFISGTRTVSVSDSPRQLNRNSSSVSLFFFQSNRRSQDDLSSFYRGGHCSSGLHSHIPQKPIKHIEFSLFEVPSQTRLSVMFDSTWETLILGRG